jgi:hypothetical protein
MRSGPISVTDAFPVRFLKRTEGSIDGEYLPSHLSDQFGALMLLANRLEGKNLGTKQSHEMVAMIRAMADKLLNR